MERFSLEPTDTGLVDEFVTDRVVALPAARVQAWARMASRVAAAGVPTQRPTVAA
ncbi:hypothetical protein [Cellulomonas marina]|uniref:Uncharacterized protein n=1 Tax=Cellulomonas marina TaxID=988821 RepID=A0A1I0YHR5_9CELL|nr:hypothetical protein [Cellulomonas marina]GIG28698.1 hypothetical protein Cma02nite_12980 [Cellulomonas marina]SFB12286.1 hypothetical protein SAMN05421867_107146 [Cellulomonas marina]